MRFYLSQLVVSEKHMSLTDFLKLLWIDESFLRFLFCILQRWADFLINIGLLIVPKETWASLSYHWWTFYLSRCEMIVPYLRIIPLPLRRWATSCFKILRFLAPPYLKYLRLATIQLLDGFLFLIERIFDAEHCLFYAALLVLDVAAVDPEAI